MMRSDQVASRDMVEFAMQHTLVFGFFPHWLMDLRAHFSELRSRLVAMNMYDAVLRLTGGGRDLLVAYRHPSQPLQPIPSLNPDQRTRKGLALLPRGFRTWRPPEFDIKPQPPGGSGARRGQLKLGAEPEFMEAGFLAAALACVGKLRILRMGGPRWSRTAVS